MSHHEQAYVTGHDLQRRHSTPAFGSFRADQLLTAASDQVR